MVNAPIELESETFDEELNSVLLEQEPIAERESSDLLVKAFEDERSIFNRLPTEDGEELHFRLDPTLRLANLLNGTDAARIRRLAAAGVVHARVVVNMADNPNNEQVYHDGTSFEQQVIMRFPYITLF